MGAGEERRIRVDYAEKNRPAAAGHLAALEVISISAASSPTNPRERTRAAAVAEQAASLGVGRYAPDVLLVYLDESRDLAALRA